MEIIIHCISIYYCLSLPRDSTGPTETPHCNFPLPRMVDGGRNQMSRGTKEGGIPDTNHKIYISNFLTSSNVL